MTPAHTNECTLVYILWNLAVLTSISPGATKDLIGMCCRPLRDPNCSHMRLLKLSTSVQSVSYFVLRTLCNSLNHLHQGCECAGEEKTWYQLASKLTHTCNAILSGILMQKEHLTEQYRYILFNTQLLALCMAQHTLEEYTVFPG